MGDPCGVGPEVLVKALTEKETPALHARVFAIGSAAIMQEAARSLGAALAIRAVARAEDLRFDAGRLDVLDPGGLAASDITSGRVSAACGRAVVAWRSLAARLAADGHADALVQGPIHMESIALGTGMAAPPPLGGVSSTHLLLVSGELRVVHLSDHVTLRAAIDRVRRADVLALILRTNDALKQWGLVAPRLAVAGLNPHCKGPEDDDEIAPAVAAARGLGVDVVGPLPPDTVFHAGGRGAYDCVVAHYHDQGHIAVKTDRFAGSCAIVLGEPWLRVSVAHGTAFDIAGKGLADARAMRAALRTAASLAAGQGFPAS